MPTMDDLIRLIQETETAKNDALAKAQAEEAAGVAAAAAAEAARAATADKQQALAAQAAKVDEVLATVKTLYA